MICDLLNTKASGLGSGNYNIGIYGGFFVVVPPLCRARPDPAATPDSETTKCEWVIKTI